MGNVRRFVATSFESKTARANKKCQWTTEIGLTTNAENVELGSAAMTILEKKRILAISKIFDLRYNPNIRPGN
jgi:hypothetical protein